jgi:hypothetical protein
MGLSATAIEPITNKIILMLADAVELWIILCAVVEKIAGLSLGM